MVKSTTVENEVKSLLKRRGGEVIARDPSDFRSKLNVGGIKIPELLNVLAGMQYSKVIRIKKVEGGTRVRLRRAHLV